MVFMLIVSAKCLHGGSPTQEQQTLDDHPQIVIVNTPESEGGVSGMTQIIVGVSAAIVAASPVVITLIRRRKRRRSEPRDGD